MKILLEYSQTEYNDHTNLSKSGQCSEVGPVYEVNIK
jgi:hypothetical protein